jgi:hypothetical protein
MLGEYPRFAWLSLLGASAAFLCVWLTQVFLRDRRAWAVAFGRQVQFVTQGRERVEQAYGVHLAERRLAQIVFGFGCRDLVFCTYGPVEVFRVPNVLKPWDWVGRLTTTAQMALIP